MAANERRNVREGVRNSWRSSRALITELFICHCRTIGSYRLPFILGFPGSWRSDNHNSRQESRVSEMQIGSSKRFPAMRINKWMWANDRNLNLNRSRSWSCLRIFTNTDDKQIVPTADVWQSHNNADRCLSERYFESSRMVFDRTNRLPRFCRFIPAAHGCKH